MSGLVVRGSTDPRVVLVALESALAAARASASGRPALAALYLTIARATLAKGA